MANECKDFLFENGRNKLYRRYWKRDGCQRLMAAARGILGNTPIVFVMRLLRVVIAENVNEVLQPMAGAMPTIRRSSTGAGPSAL